MRQNVITPIGKIEYTDYGNNIPILYLHGGHSNCSIELFRRGFDNERFRLITPSRPGYGNTPLDNHKKPDEASKLMISLINLFDFDKIIIVGISAGGLTAISIASALGKKVDRLVLISAVSKKWLTKKNSRFLISKLLFSPKVEGITWKLCNTCFCIFPFLMSKVLFKQLSTKKYIQITKEEVAELKVILLKQRSGKGFLNDIKQDLNVEVLKAIKCPTLILHSSNDASVSVNMAYYTHKHIKDSELKLYDNKWGHLLWLGNDSKYPINDVNEFLTKQYIINEKLF